MTLTCTRCGDRVPRLTIRQTRCTPCQVAVDSVIRLDERRRTPRFAVGKSLDRWGQPA